MSDDIEINLDDPEDIGIAVDDDSPISVEMPEGGQDGRSIHPAGEWSDAIEYAYLDLVTHEGSSYTAVRAVPAGTALTDTYYWQLTAEKGDPGDPGTPVWGAITGDLSDQTDLQTALLGKAPVILSSASGSIASFSDGSPAPVTALSVSIEPVQAGTGDPSPTNVCPISGHTSATVTRTGKNLLSLENIKASDHGLAAVANLDGSINISGTTTGTWSIVCSYTNIPFKIGTYTFSIKSALEHRIYVRFHHSFENTSDYTDALILPGRTSKTITLSRDAVNYELLFSYLVNGTTYNETIYPQLELGSVPSSFEPYQGTSLTIDLGGTRYGGVLDVLTGEMTVTWGYYTVTSVNRSRDHQFYKSSSVIMPSAYGVANLVCDRFPTLNSNPGTGAAVDGINTNSSGDFIIHTYKAYSTAAEMMTDIGGQLNFACKLRTPVTVQLSPSQLSTLLGTNNIWADTGDTSVEYRADTKLYIEKLTKPTEDDMTANTNISANTFFMVGNSLYFATSAIATGTTIVPGSNCTALSLADALNNLNA